MIVIASPFDRFRSEAIQGIHDLLDCFVAPLLAMTSDKEVS